MNTENASDRREARAMLAAIALATDLPVPESIHFYHDSGILALDVPTLTAGQAWSRHLGGSTDTRVNNQNNRRYLDQGVIRWHGWRVQLWASEPVEPDAPLPADATPRG